MNRNHDGKTRSMAPGLPTTLISISWCCCCCSSAVPRKKKSKVYFGIYKEKASPSADDVMSLHYAKGFPHFLFPLFIVFKLKLNSFRLMSMQIQIHKRHNFDIIPDGWQNTLAKNHSSSYISTMICRCLNSLT